LIAVSLLTVLSAVVFSVFARGVAVEKRSREAGIHEKDAWIAADQLAREFRNAVPFPGIPFQGNAAAVFFPTVLHSGSPVDAGIGAVQYAYDAQKHALFRRERPYSELFKDKNDAVSFAPSGPFLTDVDAFTIRYYSFNKSAMKLEWTDSWDSQDAFPLGIRIEMTLGAAHKGKQVIKTVYAPFPR
jgi:hypothetical protein